MAIYRIVYRADPTSESWDVHRGRNVDRIMYSYPMIRDEGGGHVSIWLDIDTLDAAAALLEATMQIKEQGFYCDNCDQTTLTPKIDRDLIIYQPNQDITQT